MLHEGAPEPDPLRLAGGIFRQPSPWLSGKSVWGSARPPIVPRYFVLRHPDPIASTLPRVVHGLRDYPGLDRRDSPNECELHPYRLLPGASDLLRNQGHRVVSRLLAFA